MVDETLERLHTQIMSKTTTAHEVLMALEIARTDGVSEALGYAELCFEDGAIDQRTLRQIETALGC